MDPNEAAGTDSERARSGTTEVMRQWSNIISGWFVGFGVIILTGLYDPLGVHSTWPDPGQGVNLANAVIMGLSLTISVGGYAMFSRPSVRFLDDHLVARNVLHDVVIPYRSIEEIDSRGSMHLRIRAAGAWHRVWGLERTNIAMMAGRGGIAGVAEDRILERVERASEEADQAVTVTARGLGVADVTLLSLWLAYIVLGLWLGPQ